MHQSFISQYLRPYRKHIALLGLLILFGVAVQLTLPQIVRQFIDQVEQQQPWVNLLRLGMLYCLLAVTGYFVVIVRTGLKERVALGAMNDLRAELTRHCLTLDLSFYQKHSPGELIQRVDGDVSALTRFFSEMLIVFVVNTLLLVGVLVVTFIEDSRIGLAFTGFTLFALLLLYLLRNTATTQFTRLRENDADMYGFLEERLVGIEDIRGVAAEAYTSQQYVNTMHRFSRALFQAYTRIIVLRQSNSLLFATGTILALGLGIVLYQQNSITLGAVYTLYAYVRMLAYPLEQLVLQVQELQTAQASLKRIHELLSIRSTLVSGSEVLKGEPSGITFDSITFGYTADEPVLHQVSFSLPPNHILGIVGRTGSGKTTIARLLLRFYDPQSGSIQINGNDLRTFSTQSLRQQIGVVSQNVELFTATVRDNLTLFDPHVADDRLLDVIETLGLGAWFRSLPAGLDSVLQPGNLSAGQAQLVAFARIFLRDCPIVILDEASSRLDAVTEQMLDTALQALLHNRTAIIIAHRPGTLERVDKLLVMHEGRVLEYGDREILATDPRSHYTNIMQAGLTEVLR